MFSDNFIGALSNRFWSMIGLAATIGIVTGFAVPLASSYQSQKFYQATPTQLPKSAILVIPTLVPTSGVASGVPENQNADMVRLVARNRRLEALVATLQKNSPAHHRLKR
jgi:hypothetical protein